MKLISILQRMDEDEKINVMEDGVPLDKMCLFTGTVRDCKKQGFFRNAVVTLLVACGDVLIVEVDIEYQRRKAIRKEKGQ